MKFELPRGIRDIEPDEYKQINYLKDKFLDTARLFDFKIMEPSPIEMLATLEAKSGPMIKNEIYAFKDKGNRDIALRFDLTIGITRYVTSRRDLSLPAKFGSFANVWRYDEPQLGRYRWFHQWDIEIYDNFNIESDAEVIEFTEHFMNNIGLSDIRIEINDREMIEGYLREMGITDNIDEYFRAIDKASKKSRDELLEEYAMLDKDKLFALLDLSKESVSIDRLKELKSDTKRIEELLDSLKSRNVKNVKVNIGIVRGLDYYSSIVFEVFSNESKNAIVGGGRYDKLPQVFNRKDLGAVGAAGGVERILSLLKEREEIIEKVYLAYTKDLKNDAIELASILRRKGIVAVAELGSRQLKKQLEYAVKNNFNKVVILAEREFAEKKVILKDLTKKEEVLIDRDEFIEKVKNYIRH
jgi:histidyl-tRNA synthetase